MARRDGLPIWISGDTSSMIPLIRVQLQPVAGGKKTYDEAWLQALLHSHPSVLPIRQIEPNFDALIPVCRELPLFFGAGKSGALDNFFITKTGNLVLVETKLWRNPEARRAVVAQALDYASAVFRLSYGELETAVSRSLVASGSTARSLFALASEDSNELDEAEFIDAVTRNLDHGKAIVCVVGDGIREDFTSLSTIVQGHAGQRFTFVLIELAIYQSSHSTEQLVVPSILAQTMLLERGVVRIAEHYPQGNKIVVDPPKTIVLNQPGPQGMTFGEDEFYEILGRSAPGLPDLLKSFVDRAASLGIYVEVLGGLNLKHASPSGNPLNLAAISKTGFVDFGPSTWWGKKEAARAYNETVAQLAGASVVERKEGQEFVVRMPGNKMPKLAALLPQHEDAWLAAMEKYIHDCLAHPVSAEAATE